MGEHFALRVRGESMLKAGILPGDLVVVHRQPTARHGEIVVALIGDEATLKRIYYDGESIMLIPANRAYQPKTYRGQELEGIRIEGKVVGYTHWF